MRKPFVAGNWKMNKTGEEARTLVADLLPELEKFDMIDRAICPPFPYLMPISAMLVGTSVGLGAQNMYWEDSGAFTGEVSPLMVAEFCQYVILGHSERRAYFGETDETVNRKVKAAFNHQLIPIVCVGETLEENEANRTAEVVDRQVREGLKGLSVEQAAKVVIAYEPVWAIGTGRAASAEGANAVLADIIRPALKDMFGEDVAQAVRIQYGGSVNAKNAAEFFAMPEIDGALVGGASLKPADFAAIVQAAAKRVA
ncbi:MAG: triose-phosphate isomerase [Chloroflexi bacterium]|nr:triose-phosphate isomerase [Chloroflexota bacterium]